MHIASGHISARMLRWWQAVPGTYIAEPVPRLHLIIRRTRDGYVFDGQRFDTFPAARAAAEAQWAAHLRASLIVTRIPGADLQPVQRSAA